MKNHLRGTVVAIIGSCIFPLYSGEDVRQDIALMSKTRETLNKDFLRLIKDEKEREKIRASSADQVVKSISSDSEFPVLFRARFWAANNQRKIIPRLIELLTSSHHVGLTNSADVIIWDRVKAGDLKFYGHGMVIEDDLFTLSGRAAWLLEEVTGQDFPPVTMTATAEDRKSLQGRWNQWWRETGKADL